MALINILFGWTFFYVACCVHQFTYLSQEKIVNHVTPLFMLGRLGTFYSTLGIVFNCIGDRSVDVIETEYFVIFYIAFITCLYHTCFNMYIFTSYFNDKKYETVMGSIILVINLCSTIDFGEYWKGTVVPVILTLTMLFSWGVLLIPTCERGVCNSKNPILSPEGMLSFPLYSYNLLSTIVLFCLWLVYRHPHNTDLLFSMPQVGILVSQMVDVIGLVVLLARNNPPVITHFDTQAYESL